VQGFWLWVDGDLFDYFWSVFVFSLLFGEVQAGDL
jgi:hypothetical protein